MDSELVTAAVSGLFFKIPDTGLTFWLEVKGLVITYWVSSVYFYFILNPCRWVLKNIYDENLSFLMGTFLLME